MVYDSQFGNTEEVARTVATVLDVPATRVSDVTRSDLQGLTLLVVGSPTQGGRPTKPTQQFLRNLPPDAVADVMA